MGEEESNSTCVSLQLGRRNSSMAENMQPIAVHYKDEEGKDLSYHKVGSNLRTDQNFPYIESDEVQNSGLELEWDMETELEELGTSSLDQYQENNFTEDFQPDSFNGHFKPDNFTDQELKQPKKQSHSVTSSHLTISPKGRFQRLQEEPEYFSHCSESGSKLTLQHFCRIFKLICTCLFIFILGLLIGYFSKRPSYLTTCCVTEEASSSETQFLADIVNSITKENIERNYRHIMQISVNKTNTDKVKEIALLWTSLGLKEVQLVNYSVILDLPGATPNTITVNNGQCYYPSGQTCDEKSKGQEFLHSYAAYSARGTLKGEIVDVQYGTVEDLQKIKLVKPVKNSIALIKLGVLPFLYKLSLLEELGFGGALVYIDPCDLPEGENSNDQFSISLNNGFEPFTSDFSAKYADHGNMTANLTTLLVQPVTVALLRKIFKLPENTGTSQCLPVKLPETENCTIILKIQSVSMKKEITNSFGFLRGAVLPDRYVILGSPHLSVYAENNKDWVSSAAILASIIESVMLKVKGAWRPKRTIIFCSWGGTFFGNIGSYKWTEEFKRLLESNAVAYIGLQNPIHGNVSLLSFSSPSLQQITTEVLKKVCSGMESCYKSNVSALQMKGDADVFLHQLGIPAVQFVFDNVKNSETTNFISEAFFIAEEETNQKDPSFYLHEYIAKLTSEMILQVASEPVLPFNALDVALEIQKNIEGDDTARMLMEKVRSLRETAQLFQSNEMRPANDPKERDPIRVRILNDILQNFEKNFLIQKSPIGFSRNILYRLDEKTTRFSILQNAKDLCNMQKSNETLLAALQEVLNCVTSAELYLQEGLHVFESDRTEL
ncbi:inactive N-acetylated-alpha-linked acidic dipeptidase-like protein 2 [Xenopus laevis]|uniref:Inactive N-acetylated-alpha-linked acidic dipeptidase-like protein 2 n=2 Tax=Xenopus laevis TaxID=8355 RepID=A0A8J0VBR1_XENLA|nr:inactive N-acetylated-alpha-linked acidic dipeptidase-like protein 2 [Xenopus laevis]